MSRIFKHMALTTTVAALVLGQTSQRSERNRSASDVPANRSYSGILLDAGCQAVRDEIANKSFPDRPPRGPSGPATGVNPDHAGQPAIDKKNPQAQKQSKAGGSAAVNDPFAGVRGPDIDDGRSAAEATIASQWPNVREKYRDCKVTPTTMSFALLTDGTLYNVDDAAGSLRQKVTSDKKMKDWPSVSVTGLLQGDRIVVSSVR